MRLKTAQTICKFLPPIIGQRVRTLIFPRSVSIEKSQSFVKKAITGSIFMGETSDFHSYPFSVHGYFDWRNVVIASILLKRNSGDIIEVGANIGTETICFCDVAKPQKVHAFEPLPSNIERLNLISKNNQDIDNLVIYPLAVSDRKSEVDFAVPFWTASGNGGIASKNSNDKLIKVNTITLDELKSDFNFVTLISIDVEGHELFVLNGASQIIKEFRPFVIIEVSSRLLKSNADCDSQQIFEYFVSKDYLCYQIIRFSIKKVDLDGLDSDVESNWLCFPSEKQSAISEIKSELRFRAFLPWGSI